MKSLYAQMQKISDELANCVSDTEVSAKCWASLPELRALSTLEIERLTLQTVNFDSGTVTVGNASVRQGATRIALAAHSEPGNVMWLQLELLPDLKRAILSVLHEPPDQTLTKTLAKLLRSGTTETELSSLDM